MTIEIDDSGTGDLLGNAFIGIRRVETDEIIFKTIPVEKFDEKNWKNKIPMKMAVDLVKEGLKELNFQKKEEKVLLCRGNIFDQVRDYFHQEGIDYEPAIIEGKLQDAVEERFISHLQNDIGVHSRNLTIESGKKRYFVLFNWLCRDFYKREKYVKSGFKKWKTKWRTRAIERFENRK